MRSLLGETQGIKKEITALEREVMQVRAMAERATSWVGHGGSSNLPANKVAEGAIALNRLEKVLETKRKNYVKQYFMISDAIDMLSNPYQRTVLRLRYLAGASWKDITKTLGLSRNGAVYHHNRGIEAMRLPIN